MFVFFILCSWFDLWLFLWFILWFSLGFLFRLSLWFVLLLDLRVCFRLVVFVRPIIYRLIWSRRLLRRLWRAFNILRIRRSLRDLWLIHRSRCKLFPARSIHSSTTMDHVLTSNFLPDLGSQVWLASFLTQLHCLSPQRLDVICCKFLSILLGEVPWVGEVEAGLCDYRGNRGQICLNRCLFDEILGVTNRCGSTGADVLGEGIQAKDTREEMHVVGR